MGLLGIAKTIFPGWANRAPRTHWGGYFQAVAMLVDAVVGIIEEARFAGMPGQLELDGVPNLGGFWSVDALKYIGEDRMVIRGLKESAGAYALRLRRWRDDWSRSGTAFGLLESVRGVLDAPGQVPCVLRLVTAGGDWYTLEANGDMLFQTVAGVGFLYSPSAGTCTLDTTAAQPWDWDSTSDPPPDDQDDGTRCFIIIYWPTAGGLLTDTDHTFDDPGVVADGWNDLTHGSYTGGPDAGTIGANAPFQLVESILGTIRQRRTAGFRCAYVAVTGDATAFLPDGTSPGPNAYPDGTWAWCSAYDPMSNTRIPTRFAGAEYWAGDSYTLT